MTSWCQQRFTISKIGPKIEFNKYCCVGYTDDSYCISVVIWLFLTIIKQKVKETSINNVNNLKLTHSKQLSHVDASSTLLIS